LLAQYKGEELAPYHLELVTLRKTWSFGSAARIVPMMLSREVWERIRGRC
jgi:hypothetical protein